MAFNFLMLFLKKKNKPILPLRTPDVLQNNCLDKDIQQIFYPLNFLLLLLFSSKYTIQDNYITPNGKKRHILSFLSVCFVIVVTVYDLYIDLMAHNFLLLISINFMYVYYSFGMILVFILNFVHSENNMLLIRSFQIIHRSLDFSKSVRSFVTCNWISVIHMFGLNTFIFVSFYASFRPVIFILLRNLLYITFDANILYAIHVLILLTKHVNEWIKKILTMKDEQETDQVINSEPYCKELFSIYQNILEAYKLYKTIFQALVGTIVFYMSLCFF